jgi:hypothetical protein
VYHRGGLLKEVDLGGKAQRQLLAIELMQQGVNPNKLAQALRQRWGASENTFKHLNERRPVHYHPGFGLGVSKNRRSIIPNARRSPLNSKASRAS